jgi:hypothetical protein
VGALFGVAWGTVTLSDIDVQATVSGDKVIGGVAGKIDAWNDDGAASITNVSSQGTVTSITGKAGGLLGIALHVVMNQCSSSAVVIGSHGLGGLVALVDGEVRNSIAEGSVESNGVSQWSGPTGGLLGQLARGTVEDCEARGTVTGRSPTGGLIGSDSYTNGVLQDGSVVTLGPLVIRNSRATGNVVTDTFGGGFFGQLSGTQAVLIENSEASGAVSGRYGVGGFIGNTATTAPTSGERIIRNSIWNGPLLTMRQDYSGGFIGTLGAITIEDSVASGNVRVFASSAGGRTIGGFIGRTQGTLGVVRRSRAEGDLYYSEGLHAQSGAGGFVGSMSGGLIEECAAWGNLSGLGSSQGGFAGGLSGGTIRNSYSRGNVVLAMGSTIGGFIGSLPSGSPLLENNYSTGTVSGSQYLGGFIGRNLGTPTLVQNFWDQDSSSTSVAWSSGAVGGVAGQVEGLSTSALQTPATFSSIWSSPAVWQLQQGQYPTLTSAP